MKYFFSPNMPLPDSEIYSCPESTRILSSQYRNGGVIKHEKPFARAAELGSVKSSINSGKCPCCGADVGNRAED